VGETLFLLWGTLFLLPRWMACLLTMGDFPFVGDRSAEPRSSVACNSVLRLQWGCIVCGLARDGAACALSEVSDLSASNQGIGNPVALFTPDALLGADGVKLSTFNFQQSTKSDNVPTLLDFRIPHAQQAHRAANTRPGITGSSVDAAPPAPAPCCSATMGSAAA